MLGKKLLKPVTLKWELDLFLEKVEELVAVLFNKKFTKKDLNK